MIELRTDYIECFVLSLQSLHIRKVLKKKLLTFPSNTVY